MPTVRREPAHFGEGAAAFFGWMHADETAVQRDCVAVICPPIGHEYTRSHRTVRHLADRLARRGIPSIRFDWHGVGDSPGTDLDPGRLEAWQSNIRTAVARARAWSGRARVCLVGIRLGATLAALASRDVDVDLLVLWNPATKGKVYVRELQAISMAAARAPSVEGALEAAGFLLSAETLEAIKGVDLAASTPRAARRVLLAGRDDLAIDERFVQHLAKAGVPHDVQRLPGWNGMMADHQFTVVPDEALDTIAAWVERNSDPAPAAAPIAPQPMPGALPVGFPADGASTPSSGNRATSPASPSRETAGERASESGVTEVPVRFGADEGLFGILTRASDDPARPVVLMFNAGSIHHVGANRIYVTLSRTLAALGFACLRLDLQGIGDSVLAGAGRENHPYPESATADARAAIAFLKSRFGYSQFIAMGLCSGAHTAFHAGLQLRDDEIAELVLINPVTFYWQEGMSLAAEHFSDLHAYKKSMRDPNRWLKLLRGDVNVKRLLEVAIQHPKTLARSYYDALCETLVPSKAPRLSQDLRRIFAMNRRITLLVAEGDPGKDLLMAGAKLTARRGLRSGDIRIETIPGGDHTFSQWRTRNDLVERLGAHLKPRLPGPRAAA